MIQTNIYTTDDGKTYNISFDQTKDQIKFSTLKTVKFLTIDDLMRLRDNIDKIVIKFKDK